MRRPFPSFLHLLTLLGISMSLIACSSNPMGRIFDRDGDEEVVEEEAQDDRVSVLALQQALTPNPRFIGQTLEVPPAFANNQWAQPGGEADHVMHHLSLAENLDRAWQARIGKGGQKRSPLTAPPVIADGRAYTVDTEAKVSAFDALSGDLLWQADLTPDLTDGPKRKFWQIRRGLTASEIGFGGGVAYDDDMVFMVSGFGIAAAMDAATGDVLWQAELMAPVRNPPTAANGKVFVVTTANQIVALSQETGQTLWSHESFEENARFLSNGSPAVQAGVVIAPFSSGEVVALDEGTGRLLWTATIARSTRMNALSNLNDIAGSPAIDRGAVFAVSHSGPMTAIDARTGQVVWEVPIGGLNMPWVSGEYIFVISVDGQLVALSRQDGAVVWTQELPSYENMKKKKDPITWTGPVLAGNHLILASSQGRLVQISPEDGIIVNEHKLEAPTTIPPVVAEGTVFVINEKARLEAWR